MICTARTWQAAFFSERNTFRSRNYQPRYTVLHSLSQRHSPFCARTSDLRRTSVRSAQNSSGSMIRATELVSVTSFSARRLRISSSFRAWLHVIYKLCEQIFIITGMENNRCLQRSTESGKVRIFQCIRFNGSARH